MAWKLQQEELAPLLSSAAGRSVEADKFPAYPKMSDLAQGIARTPKEAYACFAQAAQLVVKGYNGVQQLRIRVQDSDLDICLRLMRVLHAQLTNLGNVHEAGAALSNAVQCFRNGSISKEQLGAAAKKYVADMVEANGENSRIGDVLIGRWEMHQVLQGRVDAGEVQRLIAKVKAAGAWVVGGAVTGIGTAVIIDTFGVSGGLITGASAATAVAVAAGVAPAMGCLAGGLLMAGTQYYLGEKRSIVSAAAESKGNMSELWNYIIDSSSAVTYTYAGISGLKQFGVALEAAGEGEEPLKSKLWSDYPPLMLAPAELTSFLQLQSAGGKGIVADDERDAAVGRALYNPLCKLPKEGLAKGWAGGAVSVLNRTDENVRVLLRAGLDTRIDQKLPVNQQLHKPCYLVHHSLCIFKGDQKVVSQTVYGSSDWVLFKKDDEFRLGNRRKLQQLLRDN